MKVVVERVYESNSRFIVQFIQIACICIVVVQTLHSRYTVCVAVKLLVSIGVKYLGIWTQRKDVIPNCHVRDRMIERLHCAQAEELDGGSASKVENGIMHEFVLLACRFLLVEEHECVVDVQNDVVVYAAGLQVVQTLAVEDYSKVLFIVRNRSHATLNVVGVNISSATRIHSDCVGVPKFLHIRPSKNLIMMNSHVFDSAAYLNSIPSCVLNTIVVDIHAAELRLGLRFIHARRSRWVVGAGVSVEEVV